MEDFLKILVEHEHVRKNAINMIASENRASPLVRLMMASDLAHRYSDELYGGSQNARQIIQLCETILRKVFHADHVLVTPISGNLAVLSAVLGLTKYGSTVAKVFAEDGGYPLNLEAFNRKGRKLPFNETIRSIDMNSSEPEMLKNPPALIMLGQSVFTHTHPVKEMRKFIDDHALKSPLVYDGSHVLGLIAGHEFQDPLNEGADLLLGSTHKTFFGPQGGVLLSNNKEVFNKVKRFGDFIHGSLVLIDNMHVHRVAALAVAGLELLEFGKDYAGQVVKNSKALALRLVANGVPVKGKEVGFTQSHQVLLDYEPKVASKIKLKLESIGIFTDSMLRFGTAEMTRLGMKEGDMHQVADLITTCIQEGQSAENLAKEVMELSSQFATIQYTFDLSSFPSIRPLIQSYFPI